MSNIPQLMGRRELEHDLRFSNKGPISGLVDGVQSITMADTVTLSWDESATQMTAHVLAVDPTGQRILKLPAKIDDADSNNLVGLKGRTITIINTADGYDENIIVQRSNGSFITQIGRGDVSKITFTNGSGSQFYLHNDLLSTTVSVADGDTSEELVPAVAGYHIIPVSAVILAPSGNPANNTFQFKFNTDVVTSYGASDVAQDEAIYISLSSATGKGSAAGVALSLALSDPDAELRVKTSYRLMIADLA